MTDKLRLQYIREGRGQGTRNQYKPWLTVHNVPSKGIVTRIYSKKTGRIHHYLSRNEMLYHILLDNNPQVLDIREQFPLKLKETLRISEKLGYRHPSFGGEVVVCTTDFLITTANHKLVARAVKPSKELSDARVREKLSIEYLYWKEHQIDWKIVTERDLNITKAENLIWLNSGEELCNLLPDSRIREQASEFFLGLYADPSVSFDCIIEATEDMYQLQPGTAITIFKALIRAGRISIALDQPIHLADPRSHTP